MSDDDRFFIDEDNADSIILAAQPATAVYTNPKNAVVIRQEQQEYQHDDQVVIIRPENVVAICLAMLREACLDYVLTPRRQEPPALPAPDQPRDRTGAERQRRYRASRRDGSDRYVTRDERDAPSLQFEQEAAE